MSSEAATASKIEEDKYILGYVYIISDTKNNQCLYIGSSHNIKKRLNKHFSDLNKNKNELYIYINNLGIENINIKILDTSRYKNKYELRNKEQDYINSYRTKFNKKQSVFKYFIY
jgi:excinuclease UvrABC nuclease subunit